MTGALPSQPYVAPTKSPAAERKATARAAQQEMEAQLAQALADNAQLKAQLSDSLFVSCSEQFGSIDKKLDALASSLQLLSDAVKPALSHSCSSLVATPSTRAPSMMTTP